MRKKIIYSILFTALSLLVSFVVSSSLSKLPFSQQTTVWVFDVGQGDSIFIDAPDAQVLIDGGPGDAVVEKLSHVLPIWDRSIDIAIATHPHADHIRGLVDAADYYHFDALYVNGEAYNSRVNDILLEAYDEQVLFLGKRLQLGDSVFLDVVWPEADLAGTAVDDPNDASIVLLLTVNGSTMLLTGDAGAEQEARFGSLVGDIDVLKVGHHGSRTSSSEAFLDVIEPEYAIISAGEGNSYGHPHAEILKRFTDRGVRVFRTDVQGDVRIRFLQEGLQVREFAL